ncbi:MAG: hypothetical protein M3Y27_07935, partial [Acidobacteriota bacterium]|nr:hypothetical protein [Acidobacteriota bacterium]
MRSAKLLLTGIVLMAILIELTVRFGLGKASRIEGRIESEYRAVLAIKGGSSGGPKTLVVLGNSLLLEGVDFPVLKQSLAPDIQATRLVIEQTDYLDWYYGLRKFYTRGVHPDVVALNLTAVQMVRDNIRGEYFAYRMMNTRDVFRAASDAKLSATATFSLLVGNLSAFYGTRVETRKFVLSKLIPGVNQLISAIVPMDVARPLDHEPAVASMCQRLRIIDALVRTSGGRFILIQPASLNLPGMQYLSEAGAKTGVQVLTPLPVGA